MEEKGEGGRGREKGRGCTSGAVRRMRLRACTMAAPKGRSGSSDRMLARVVNSGCAPSSEHRRRRVMLPRLSSNSLPPGSRNLPPSPRIPLALTPLHDDTLLRLGT